MKTLSTLLARWGNRLVTVGFPLQTVMVGWCFLCFSIWTIRWTNCPFVAHMRRHEAHLTSLCYLHMSLFSFRLGYTVSRVFDTKLYFLSHKSYHDMYVTPVYVWFSRIMGAYFRMHSWLMDQIMMYAMSPVTILNQALILDNPWFLLIRPCKYPSTAFIFVTNNCKSIHLTKLKFKNK